MMQVGAKGENRSGSSMTSMYESNPYKSLHRDIAPLSQLHLSNTAGVGSLQGCIATGLPVGLFAQYSTFTAPMRGIQAPRLPLFVESTQSTGQGGGSCPSIEAGSVVNLPGALLDSRSGDVHAASNEEGKRMCSKCKKMRSFPEEFHKSGSGRNGFPTFRPDCIECHRKLDRAAKRKKRAQVREEDVRVKPKSRRAKAISRG